MEQAKTEEKSPLLFYLTERDEDLSKNNKRLNFEKSRLYGISSGATAVFTDFPNYISPCWTTTILSGLICFMMLLLTVSTIGSSRVSRLPRCAGSQLPEFDNRTIHLIHDSSHWSPKELNILKQIKNEYPGYLVQLMILKNKQDIFTTYHSTETTTSVASKGTLINAVTFSGPVKVHRRKKRNVTSLKHRKVENEGLVGMGVKSLLDILLNSRLGSGFNKRNNNISPSEMHSSADAGSTSTKKAELTFDSIIEHFDNLTIEYIPNKEAFLDTPLEHCWHKFNYALLEFSLRVLRLWQFGGISFKINQIDDQILYQKLDNFSVSPGVGVTVSPSSDTKLMDYVTSGRIIFENLPDEVVTADDEGLHMFTKSPCHAFFGEVIMMLKKARGDETVKDVIRKSLRMFCLRSSLARKYCKNFVRKLG